MMMETTFTVRRICDSRATKLYRWQIEISKRIGGPSQVLAKFEQGPLQFHMLICALKGGVKAKMPDCVFVEDFDHIAPIYQAELRIALEEMQQANITTGIKY